MPFGILISRARKIKKKMNIVVSQQKDEEEEDRCRCLFPLKGRFGHVIFLEAAVGLGTISPAKPLSFLGTVSIKSLFARVSNSFNPTWASS